MLVATENWGAMIPYVILAIVLALLPTISGVIAIWAAKRPRVLATILCCCVALLGASVLGSILVVGYSGDPVDNCIYLPLAVAPFITSVWALVLLRKHRGQRSA